MNHADRILTVSDYELKIINEEIPGNKGYLTPGFYYEETNIPRKKIERDDALMFVGGFNHTPNRDAVDWFMSEMWPIILSKKPDCVFYIIGSNPPDSIKKYESENVHVTGYVSAEELEDY